MKRITLIITLTFVAFSFGSCISVDDLKPETPVYQPEEESDNKQEAKPEEEPEEQPEKFDLIGTPDGTEVQLTGVVAAVTKRGFVLSIDDVMLYVYAGAGWTPSVEMYDNVEVSGTLSTYWNNRELVMEKVSVTGNGSINSTSPYNLTKYNISTFSDSGYLPCMVKVTGVLQSDGAYNNMDIGDDEYLISLEFPMFDLEPYYDKEVTVTGYYLWTSYSEIKEKHFIDIAVTSIEL